MKPIPLLYAVQSESGQYFGYVMTLEVAKQLSPKHHTRPYVSESNDRLVLNEDRHPKTYGLPL
ncbi:hypothetical protein SAMN05421868_13441 [Paenibacillus naphthalenovorans]|nr:hypothetical protein SAMN05421868_13441 [Paenibacillus naphthalenovorans]